MDWIRPAAVAEVKAALWYDGACAWRRSRGAMLVQANTTKMDTNQVITCVCVKDNFSACV